jgi:hypothetical protein
MNTNHWLRILFLEWQVELYASAGAILPPYMNIRRGAGEWKSKRDLGDDTTTLDVII